MKRTLVAVALAVMAAGCDNGVPKSQFDALSAQDKQDKEARAEAEKRIAELESRVHELEGEQGKSSDATKAELEELRKQKETADARAKLFDDFVEKFKSMMDAGKLDIATRRGQIVLALATDVLFDAGKTEVRTDGKAALAEVAAALKTVQGRRFQVAGHTDTFPIHTKEFASNWELSTARAVEVVKLLVKEGVKAEALSAAGYAEFDPLHPNSSDKDRAKNRRIEIVLVPNIEELVKMPELKPEERAHATPATTPPPVASTAPAHHAAPKKSAPKKK